MRWMLLALLMLGWSCSSRGDQGHAVVKVRGPAVADSASLNVSSSSPEDFAQFAYPVEVVGYGEDGKHVKTISVEPKHVLAAFGGHLLGGDRGEWGGELVFRDRDAVNHLLLNQDVRAIILMPFGVVVFTGLAHMGFSNGAMYVVRLDTAQLPHASLLHGLSGAPSDIRWTTGNDLVFTVQPGIRSKHDFFSPPQPECYLLGKRGELKSLPCESISSK